MHMVWPVQQVSVAWAMAMVSFGADVIVGETIGVVGVPVSSSVGRALAEHGGAAKVGRWLASMAHSSQQLGET